MWFFIQKIPVKLPLLTPFTQLSKFLSHKQKFFAWMEQHKCIRSFQITNLFFRIAWHLINHRTFQMYDFIMRDDKDIFFTVCISHRKCHLIVIVLTEIWIQFHVFKKIIHPSHIPFQRESKSSIFSFSGNLWPCGRFFCYHDRSMISSKYNGIQMFEKLNCFKVFVITIFISNPLAILLSIIQIKHRCYCINTKSVYMTLFNPVECIGNQEVFDLRTAIVINLGSPVRMFSLSRIFMFIYCCTVKICEALCIFRKMCRYPVQNNSNLITVQIIDHILEILNRTITGGWCIISCDLISP